MSAWIERNGRTERRAWTDLDATILRRARAKVSISAAMISTPRLRRFLDAGLLECFSVDGLGDRFRVTPAGRLLANQPLAPRSPPTTRRKIRKPPRGGASA